MTEMKTIMEGAEPFLFPGNKTGILLIHGFTGSPSEMRPLGEYLHKQLGATVMGIRLAGHGANEPFMEKTGWESWFNSVCDGYILLKQLCDEITVVGLSMGGLLALRLAMEYPVDKVVTMSAPQKIINRALELLGSRKECQGRFVSKKRRRFDAEMQQYSVAYRLTPLVCVHELLYGIRFIRENMDKLKAKLLVIQSENDHTVKAVSGQMIYDGAVNASERQLLMLKKSGHIVTLGEERDKVYAAVSEFIIN